MNAMTGQSNEGCLNQDGRDMKHTGTWSLTNNTSTVMDGTRCSTRGQPFEQKQWDGA
jgi:hypothetical protein